MKKFMILAILCALIIATSVIAYSQAGKDNENGGSASGIEKAKSSVRAFVGDPAIKVDYKDSKSLPLVDVNEMCTSQGTFYVDNATGDVISAYFNQSARNSKELAIGIDAVEKIARQYASNHYANFTRMNMVLISSKLADHGDAGKAYEFTWNERHDGVYTLNKVFVAINPTTGNVISYNSMVQDTKISTTPLLDQSKAVGLARSRHPDFAANTTAADLYIVSPDRNKQILSWVVAEEGTDEDGYSVYHVTVIDADTGNIL